VNDSNNLLSQLRDIHAAADPGWWPPAPGWWVLALLVLALVAWMLRYGYRRWMVMRRRRKLLSALEDMARAIDPLQQPHEYLSRLNRLFRVVALRAFPNTACVRLQGIEWVRFIQSLLPQNVHAEGLSALASGPYQPKPEFDAGELHALARIWVGKYG
jgi:hypothetical protein